MHRCYTIYTGVCLYNLHRDYFSIRVRVRVRICRRMIHKATDAHYWLQWSAIVCAVLLVIAVVGAVYVICKIELGSRRNKKYDLFAFVADDGELWKTCWKGISPKFFLFVRFLILLALLGLLAADVSKHSYRIFYFYTQWTFALVAVYFAMATWISFRGCMESVKKNSSRNQDQLTDSLKTDAEQGVCTNGNTHRSSVILQSFHERKENRKKTGLLGYTMQVIFQTCGGAVMMTDIVFWGIIVPFLQTTRFQVNTLMACMHSVNFIFLFIDAMLNSMHFPWFRGAYFVLWTAGYVIFQWILHVCGFTWWPYPFLELSTPWAPVWYLGLAVLCVVCYALFWLLIKTKEWLFPKIFPNSYRALL